MGYKLWSVVNFSPLIPPLLSLPFVPNLRWSLLSFSHLLPASVCHVCPGSVLPRYSLPVQLTLVLRRSWFDGLALK